MVRIITIFILLLFISIKSFSQSWEELNNQLAELHNRGEYEKAIPVAEKVVQVAKKEFGIEHTDYATSLNDLALLYVITGHYKKAEPLYIQAKEIYRKILGENHPDYATSLNNLAELYKNTGQYEKAEPLYIQAKEIFKKVLGENHPDYATSLSNLAGLYLSMDQYEKAEPLCIQAKEIFKKVLGENHPSYSTSLSNLASLYVSMGKYEKAEPLFIESKEIQKKILGENNPDYATSLNNLAGLYKDIGQYKNAESLYIQTKEIYRKILGENHPSYATSLNNLALLYAYMGQNEKAEPLYIQASEIQKRILGENHPSYATSLSNLATLYVSMSKYEKAEPLFIESKEIQKKIVGGNHSNYATNLNNLAQLYEKMGQYEKAEPLFVQVERIFRKIRGENHPDYATCLSNLAVLYEEMGQNEKALLLFVQAKEIQKKIFGENHPSYATSLSNLAVWYENMHQYDKAETLFIQAKEIRIKILGENHPSYATGLNNLAQLYEKMGQYEKVESLYIQAKEIQKKLLGENHIDYANTINNLAFFYISMSQYKKAESLILSDSRIVLQNLKNTFTFLSEKEKENYVNNNVYVMGSNNSFLYYYKKASSSIIVNNFNLQLFFKSLLLSETKNMLQSVRNSEDSGIEKLFKEWHNNKSLLAKQYSLPIINRMPDLDSLETQAENLEKELTRKSSAFRKQQSAIRISMPDVQKNLQEDEAAIEFVKFRLYNKKWTDSIIYAAYILHKNDSVPVFVSLCEEKQLEPFFTKTGANENIKAIYRSTIDEAGENKIQLGDSLYSLVWKPLLPYLNGVKKIDYSPAGLLYKVAFHALPADSNQLLLDKYELNQYISIRQIAVLEEEKSNTDNSIALFGDCAFTMDSAAIANTSPANEFASNIFSSSISRGNNTKAWQDLPGTANEIKNIQSLFEKNKINTVSYTKQQASEEKFKSLSGHSPSIIHLATHGFFLPDPQKKKKEGLSLDDRNSFTLADDPLLRSGIILSGANRVWSGQPPIEGREDGIVTAYEISQMDLSNTQLVVLSACETALGDVKGNEGVFGLQRAFKLAGVKNMILSLWRVPDKETTELMTDFYSYYLQGKSIREAFNTAQKDMRAKYKPYYWAAFVLIE